MIMLPVLKCYAMMVTQCRKALMLEDNATTFLEETFVILCPWLFLNPQAH